MNRRLPPIYPISYKIELPTKRLAMATMDGCRAPHPTPTPTPGCANHGHDHAGRWRLLLLLALACCGLRTASARTDDLTVTLSKEQPWVYLGKFGFTTGNQSTVTTRTHARTHAGSRVGQRGAVHGAVQEGCFGVASGLVGVGLLGVLGQSRSV
jgi:hypothetical protein